MERTSFDVAVIGGGPAGCSAAISLAMRGVRVALFEAQSYPHAKLCGEFLSPEGVLTLGDLGLSEVLSAREPARIDEVRVTAPGGGAWRTHLPGPALGLSRFALDAALADRARRAGARVFERVTIDRVSGNLGNGFVLESRALPPVRAALVVGAYGRRAALDRALGRQFILRRQPFLAFQAHFHGPPVPHRVELHTFPGGYCGIAPVEGGRVNVCLLAHETAFRGAAGPDRLATFLEWMQARNPYLHGWWKEAARADPRWHAVGQVPFSPKAAVVHDLLMAGDTAGVIVPLAGDGIAMALRSGMLAAEHAHTFLSGPVRAADLREGYTRAWTGEFGARIRLGRLLQGIMLRPKLVDAALRLFTRLPAAGDFVIRHTRDVRPLARQALNAKTSLP